MTGLLHTISSEIRNIFVCMIFVAYLGHGIFHPVEFFFLVAKSVLGLREVTSPQINGTSEKTTMVGAPLYRSSTRRARDCYGDCYGGAFPR